MIIITRLINYINYKEMFLGYKTYFIDYSGKLIEVKSQTSA